MITGSLVAIVTPMHEDGALAFGHAHECEHRLELVHVTFRIVDMEKKEKVIPTSVFILTVIGC